MLPEYSDQKYIRNMGTVILHNFAISIFEIFCMVIELWLERYTLYMLLSLTKATKVFYFLILQVKCYYELYYRNDSQRVAY